MQCRCRSKKVIVVLGCILLTLGAVGTFISPIILMANEHQYLKDTLNNKYINANYEGWNAIDFGSCGSIMLPGDWFVSCESSSFSIIDGKGMLVAQGTVIGSSEFSYKNRTDFISSLVGKEILEIKYEYIPEFVSINGSHFGRFTLADGLKNVSNYFLSIKVEQTIELFFVFPSTTTMEIVEIVQAIVFFYHFPT